MRGALGVLSWRSRSKWDHPRTCGEHRVKVSMTWSIWGSSPHMRGALAEQDEALAQLGIIPAHAGSTGWVTVWKEGVRDHPRTCGEHVGVTTGEWGVSGSSPHMRGAQLVRAGHRLWQGIIPAHAGSTCCCRWWSARSWDHPRTCGEHLPVRHPHLPGAGIIPAHAGSTQVDGCCVVDHRDHPRTCGEHFMAACATVAASGSSPHMRGAPRPVQLHGGQVGIIPAHAGSTAHRLVTPKAATDHPRTCGEHLLVPVHDAFGFGSSPHMRGAPNGTR